MRTLRREQKQELCHCQARVELLLQCPDGEASDELEVQVEIPETDSDITGI